MNTKIINTVISKVGIFLIRLILLIYSVIVLYPVIWTIISSFKTTGEFYANVWALPASFRKGFVNYQNAWKLAEIGKNLVNSIIVVGFSMALNVVLSAMSAYVVARFKFFGSKTLGKLYILGLFVPLVLGTIPTFFVLMQLKLYDTYAGLIIVYATYSMPLSVFIMMGIYESIPKAFEEAAMLDGCGYNRTF